MTASRTTEIRLRGTQRRRVAEAALGVLAEQGSRGLTHRAVDSAAGLPSGSTSNHFRTRSALLEGALRAHVELDLPPGGDPAELRNATLNREQAADLLAAALDRILEPRARRLLVARYELMLEASRREELRREFGTARRRFVDLAEAVLVATGCESPRPHAVQLVALMDGLLVDQLIAADSALDRDGIREAIGRQLASC